MYLRTEGVILKRKNFGEADRILTIFTRDFGKVSCLAKGVRRPRSKKAGHLELGNWCKVFLAKGKNLDLLTEVELKRAFGISHFTEQKANRIYHILELVNSLTPEHQKNRKVFVLLVQFLKKAEKEEDFNLVSSVFKIKLLSELGFFSSHSLPKGKNRDVITILETENFDSIKDSIKLSQESYLKLLSFLDSMIESVSEQELRTLKFLNG